MSVHTVKRKKTQTHHNWFLMNCSRVLLIINCGIKGPGYTIQSSKSYKIYPKDIIYD